MCSEMQSFLNRTNRADLMNTGKTGAVTQLLLEAPPDKATLPTQLNEAM